MRETALLAILGLMNIIPAIDLLDGSCVRLKKGNYNESTLYSRDPVKTAEEICNSGCSRLHIVDLDAARGTGKTNRNTIHRIREAVPGVILETGGGIRTERDVEELLEIGMDRLILGTVFARNPLIGLEWTNKYGKVFIAGIDALNGEVKISGWEQGSSITATELAVEAADNGIISIIYTNIDRDGMLSGPDIENTLLLAEVSDLPVILSGGISSTEDFRQVAEAGRDKIVGVITGKALYEEKFDLKSIVSKYNSDVTGELW